MSLKEDGEKDEIDFNTLPLQSSLLVYYTAIASCLTLQNKKFISRVKEERDSAVLLSWPNQTID